MMLLEQQIVASVQERYFPKPIQLEDQHLQPIGEGGHVCDVYRISSDSPLYGGHLLKVLREANVTEKKLKMFALNADALDKVNGANGRVPKLLIRGHYSNQPAVVEELLPGVKDTEFDDYLRSLNPEERVQFYRSLTVLYADLERQGIIHADLQGPNFAVMPQMNAGLIDFGIAYVDGSEHNIFSGRSQIQRKTIDGLVDYIKKIESQADGYVAGVYRLKKVSGTIQNLAQFAEKVKEKLKVE